MLQATSGCQLISNVGAVMREFDKQMVARTLEAAMEVKAAWLKMLRGKRSGRRYRVPPSTARLKGKRRRKVRWYTASAPGEPPARLHGDLARSISAATLRVGGEIQGLVGSPMKKSVWLEKGTRKMKPRPSLGPAMRRSRKKVQRILSRRMF